MQLNASMSIVVGNVRAGCARLNVFYHDLFVGVFLDNPRLNNTVGICASHPHLHSHCLDAVLASGSIDGGHLVVKLTLALLHCPLELPREKPDVIMRLQTISSSEYVYRDFRTGKPIT